MKVKRIIKDDILSSKKLLELAKRVNWNEDKMLDELRKQNPKVSNSDLQAIVEAFILKNKPKQVKDLVEKDNIIETYLDKSDNSKIFIVKVPSGKFYNVYGEYKGASNAGPYKTLDEARKYVKKHRSSAVKDSNERLKSYNIKNHNTGITYKVKATSYRDAKDKYEKYISDEKNWIMTNGDIEYKIVPIDLDKFNVIDEKGKKLKNLQNGEIFTTHQLEKLKMSMRMWYKDSFSEDSLSDVITYYKKLQKLSYDTPEKEIFNLLNEGTRLATLAEKHIENTAKHLKERIYEKENANVKTYIFERNLKYTLVDIANFFDREFEREALSEWENGRIIGKRFTSKHSHYISIANKLSKRFFEVYKQYNKVFEDSFTRDVNDEYLYILTQNHYRAVTYNQALEYGEKYGLAQVFKVDKNEFKKLVKTAKEARISNPNEWAFHRLHSARKTKTFDSFNEDALSQSDIEIIEDSISLMKRKNISITSTNVIDYLEENFKGFVGRNKQDIIEYVKRKYFKDSFNEDTNDYIITLVNHRGTNLDLENLSPLSRKVDIKNLLKNVDFNERDILNTLNNANLIYNNWKFHSKDKTTISVFAEDKTKNKYILRIFNKSIQDSFSEDAKCDTLLANLGFSHYQGHGEIQKWKYREEDKLAYEKAIEHIRRVDNKLILSSNKDFIITVQKPIKDDLTGDSDDLYIITKQNYKAVNYNQALDYGEKYGLHQVFRVDRKEFNSLVKTAKSANVRNPNEWAFNRLHLARKTKTFDSFTRDNSTVTISVKPKGYLTSKNTQNTAEEIYNVTIKRRSNGDITVSGKIQNIEKFLKQSLFDGGLVPGSIKIVNDSLTEDEQLKYQTTFRGEESQEIRLLEGSCYCNYDKTRNVTHVTFMGGQRNQTSRDFTIRGKITTVEQLKKEIDKHLKYLSSIDSFSEDATLAQLEIKNTFLEEDDDADEVKYLGFNDNRKISFYEYKDKYFAFFDLENRVEVITKDEVQRILKKNIIEASEKNKDELYREGDEGIAATVRSEDSEIISLSQFSPERLIKAVINNNQAMHNYVKAPDGNTYFIAVYSDFVSVVRVEPNGKQKRVVDKSFTKFNFEEALVILKEIEKQLSQGGYK